MSPLSSQDRNKIYMAIYATVLILIGSDVSADMRAHLELEHILLEAVIMALCFAGLVILLRASQQLRKEHENLRQELETAHQSNQRFQQENQELVRGLGAAIEIQFKDWKLSPAESQVALLLLKGLSHREAADIRETSERTVRQQSREVYRKADLSGRAALSAYFLEDLLLPLEK